MKIYMTGVQQHQTTRNKQYLVPVCQTFHYTSVNRTGAIPEVRRMMKEKALTALYMTKSRPLMTNGLAKGDWEPK